MVVVVAIVAMLFPNLEFFRHGRQGHSLWQIWQWIDETSLLAFVVVEAASLSELALASFLPVLAGSGFVVGVDGSQRSLSEVLWQWVIGLSQVLLTMRKLTVLCERALVLLQVVLAELSFVLLLQGVELALVAVEVVVV